MHTIETDEHGFCPVCLADVNKRNREAAEKIKLRWKQEKLEKERVGKERGTKEKLAKEKL